LLEGFEQPFVGAVREDVVISVFCDESIEELDFSTIGAVRGRR
jgi:hypothetical protein